jgi:hypothetical protein
MTGCKENVYLYLVELTEKSVYVTVCRGAGYEHDNGEMYYEPVVLVDSVFVEPCKYQIRTTIVEFKAPEVAYDTIVIRAAELPYSYRGHEIADFGEYDLMIRAEGECDEQIMLQVRHLTTTVTVERDTTLCRGKGYEHGGEMYYEATTLVDEEWVNRDTMVVTTTRVNFVEPEMEYDTVSVSTVELLEGYYYEVAREYVYASGDYFYEIEIENECTRMISLNVIEIKDTTALEDVDGEQNRAKMVMVDGVIYVYHNGLYYTLMGERVDRERSDELEKIFGNKIINK